MFRGRFSSSSRLHPAVNCNKCLITSHAVKQLQSVVQLSSPAKNTILKEEKLVLRATIEELFIILRQNVPVNPASPADMKEDVVLMLFSCFSGDNESGWKLLRRD